ncbi:lipopolysaccharide biosynthesis protein [Sphingobium sufflavum]|uniref:lipopolysaccharide biosynthesis protein n=1 Tax=Sphingobium sufflavum TaxID=1129547 RepID=UPI001F212D76|nr:lipopolysaccharide biosynthesis protein [Sphingobium sufflavum]MCE7798631.1 lipopolysaccharide biosynthesis protein [Sphingobium sufflavum]
MSGTPTHSIDALSDPIAAGDVDATESTFGARVRSALIWRSGAQIVTQILSWVSTLMVIRILNPADYGLFAMTQAVIAFMTFLNGYGLVSALVASETIDTNRLRQAFGLMLLLNGGLGLAQLALAPLAADYYNQPMVADMLRVQAVIYLSTPFITLPEVLMGRSLNFRKAAYVTLISGLVAAGVAITGALSGWGVWTLVWAPIAGFYVKAAGYSIVTRFFIRPSFNFRGAGPTIWYAVTLLGSQLAFLIQSQADVFIGGRALDPHALGLYAEALFLTQIFVSKFVPPINEVTFPIYARMQGDKARVADALCKAIKLVLLIACPLYLGMAVTAEPLVLTILGAKWVEMAPYVALLALAMPFLTLQVMFPPMLNAIGRPGLGARIAMIGAVIMPLAFLIGIHRGGIGLAMGWLIGYPVFALSTAHLAGRLVGLTFGAIFRAVLPGLMAAAAMAIVVAGADHWVLPGHLPAIVRLGLLVAVGGVSYAALLLLIARDTVRELIAMISGRGLGGVIEPDAA